MGISKLWRLPVVGRLGVQHGLLVGWFLLVGVLAVLLLPGPAGSANAPGSLVEAQTQTVDFGGQSHCGIVSGIGASGGSGSGDTRCTSVETGGDAQVNTDGFGDIGMQFQNSPVAAPISNVHISNEGDNNSNNSVIGNSDLIINRNVGASANASPPAQSAAADTVLPPAPAAVDAPVAAVPETDPATQASAVDLGGQSQCGVVAGVGASGGGSGSGDTRCASVEAGGDAQVNTDGFGDIGMQFQDSPVNAPITNVHVSNEGDNNSTNTIVGDHNVIINTNIGFTINA